MLNPVSTYSAALTNDWIVKVDSEVSVAMEPGKTYVSGEIILRNTTAAAFTGTATLLLLMTTAAATSGYSFDNTEGGYLYGKVGISTGVLTIKIYKDTAMTTANLVASYSGVSTTSAAFTAVATQENSSGLTCTMVFTSFSSTTTLTGTFTIQTNLAAYVSCTTAMITACGTANNQYRFVGIIEKYNSDTGMALVMKAGTVRVSKIYQYTAVDATKWADFLATNNIFSE